MIINGLYVTGDVIQMVDPTPGKVYYFQPPRLDPAQINAMISTWGLTQKARMWFNKSTQQLEMWEGTKKVIIG